MNRPHRWIKLPILRFPWVVCACCGLVRLHNPRTAEAVRKGCDPD